MRKSESGGVLLGVVALVALATFAYIGFILLRHPEVSTMLQGIEDTTENTDASSAVEGLYNTYVPGEQNAVDTVDEGELDTNTTLVTHHTARGPYYYEEGDARDIATGTETKIASLAVFDGAVMKTMMGYGEHAITIELSPERLTTFNDGVENSETWQSLDIVLTDEAGHTQTLTRKYLVDSGNESPWFDEQSQDAVEVDYSRTYRYTKYGVANDVAYDPLRSVLEFNGEGLYFWVFGGLYYYDPATGTFGLDLEHSP